MADVSAAGLSIACLGFKTVVSCGLVLSAEFRGVVMGLQIFEKRSHINCTPEQLFRWHMNPGAFERLCPPWEPVSIVSRDPGGIGEGSRVTLSVPMGPIRKHWVAEHHDIIENRQFRDEQLTGPFAEWKHTHRFEPSETGCELIDSIQYRVPMGAIGNLFGGAMVRHKLAQMFDYRHRVTIQDQSLVAQHHKVGSMKILITGATGLIGTAATSLLTSAGHNVAWLVRPGKKARHPSENAELISWDPDANYIDAAKLEGFDAIVNLAGDNIANGRWSAAKKGRIRNSRIKGTTLLCETLAQLQKPPATLISASAVGFYGNRGDEVLDESSSPASDFLADVCKQWESATAAATAKGIRVVNVRFGVVLSPKDGALAKMLFPFKMGAGGVLGSGKQYMPWIAIDDVAAAIAHCLITPSLTGPVNLVAPNPATNYEFTKTLGKVLSRPTIAPLPAFMARIVFGEMADALLLASTRVQPGKLTASGYQFRFPELEPALRHLLGKTV